VKATKGGGTHSSYETCLRWAEHHITKHLVYRLDRNDLLTLFGAGREAELNQKTINKRVTVVLNMVRHHDHCSFGVFGAVPLLICRRSILALERLQD
jgi:hypothetical protein